MASHELKLLTLNCWGLKFVSVKRKERLRAIGDWLAAAASRMPRNSAATTSSSASSQDSVLGSATALFDVVALQELWVEEDYNYIRTRLEDVGIRHSRFFHSGVIGSGLAIFSRYPIIDSFVHPYSLSGNPLHVIEGDFYAAKAVAGTLVGVPELGSCWILNTHLYAPGGEAESASGAHRLAQIWELARIVRDRGAAHHLVLMGDFNTQPAATAMRFLKYFGSLRDAWADTHPEPPALESHEHRSLAPPDCIEVHGITCDSPVNTFSAPKLRKRPAYDETLKRHGKRLDYIFFRSETGSTTGPARKTISCEKAFVTLLDVIPGLGISYSDHFGLAAVLTFGEGNASDAASMPFDQELGKMLSILSVALAQCQSRSQSLLRLFALCVFAFLACSAGASAQPLRYLSWLFVLLGGASAALAATSLYAGFIGGRWQQGTLRNIMTEMQAHLDAPRTSS